ncbi:MAG: site-specific DNA-methyltransferase [Gemmatimonadetes bacterium]|nr:site-specific DNA-methyltransferase [Gemmatimonadota bacterium]
MSVNLLIQGDNIKGLYYLLRERNLQGKIDLVYIDPPFATGSNFTITEDRAATISNSRSGSIAYSDRLTGFEFIEFLRERLLLLRELLSVKGSIYLHIDYKIGHYVKVMMDEVFGMENFRNDIARVKCNPKNFKRIGYGNVKDMILFYSKTSRPIESAQQLNRNWIGIDQSEHAIKATVEKLEIIEGDFFTVKLEYEFTKL